MKKILITIGIGIAAFISLAVLITLSLKPFDNYTNSVLEDEAQSYLTERYGQEFQILTEGLSSQLGGPTYYSPRVSLADDPAVEFGISRCLSGCDQADNAEFNDSYPYAVWSKQETEILRNNRAEYGIPQDATVNASLYGSSLNKEDKWVLADTNTGVVPFRELPSEPSRAGYTIYITLAERNPEPTEQDFLNFAETLVGIRNKMSAKGIAIGGFTASIAPREPADDSGWRFYTHTYTSPYEGKDIQTAEVIATQFKKITSYDSELFKKITGRS